MVGQIKVIFNAPADKKNPTERGFSESFIRLIYPLYFVDIEH